MQIEEYPVKVPISIADTAPASWVSNVMRVPCSGAIARPVSLGKQVGGLVRQLPEDGVRRAAVRGEIRVEMEADLLATPRHSPTL